MNRLGQFMHNVYSRLPWDGAPVPFSDLFEMLCQTLLGDVLNSHDFDWNNQILVDPKWS